MSESTEATSEAADGKTVSLTVATAEAGSFEHAYGEHHELQTVIDRTVKKLKLDESETWILEFNGTELPPTETIKKAGLKDGDVLTLTTQVGGGGSGRI